MIDRTIVSDLVCQVWSLTQKVECCGNHLSQRQMSSKSLKLDIKWEVHKRTQQGVSAKLESYIYKVYMVCTTTSCPPHFLLKATMLYTCVLTLSSRFFYYVLGL